MSADPTIVVIGSGAGGATTAYELCRRGHKVTVLEAGPQIDATQFHQDDLAAFAQLSWLDPRSASGSYRTATVSPQMPAWSVKAVGGTTLHWNALAYRMQPHEFAPLTNYGAIEGASLIDWPVDYAELDRWYSLAEDRMGVTGTHGIPAHPPSNNFKVLYNGAKRIGYTDIRNNHIAINSTERDDRAGCRQMGFCNQGCMINAKWSAAASEIRKAEATGNLTLLTEAMATRIEHDKTGRASGVVYRYASGAEQRLAAHTVIVAAGSIETARLLLLSESNHFPDGLGNRSGHVGRHYQRHIAAMSFARLPKPVNMHRGIVTPGTIFDEAGHDPSRGFAGGYLIEAAGLSPVSLAMILDPLGWGEPYSTFLASYDHLAGVLLNGEELPCADNRITLSQTTKDAAGLPAAHVHVDEHPQSDVMREHFRGRVGALYEALDADEIRHTMPPASAHNMGTCRMSVAEEDGVTDRWGQVHGIDNLFIADGSVMTSSGAENPTLTIVALALRQADEIARRL
ncbi:MAG: GMC family oxidoreductase [Erythrobacter sp.]